MSGGGDGGAGGGGDEGGGGGGGELQATIEISVEFHKFYNVDLFQRGDIDSYFIKLSSRFYQIKCHVKTFSKLPTSIEVLRSRNQGASSEDGETSSCTSNGVSPAATTATAAAAAVTKDFQILYRNEEVHLQDTVNFRVHSIVEAGKIEEMLDKADIRLTVELWYSENGFEPSGQQEHQQPQPQSQQPHIECVSSRVLNLNFQPSKGLHYHLPVLFDYFHLSAISLTVHSVLTMLHQPYISTHKNGTTSGKGKKEYRKSKHILPTSPPVPQPPPSSSSMETIFFGPPSGKGKVSSEESKGIRLSTARRIHREICSLLLGAYESLQYTVLDFSNLLLERERVNVSTSNCVKRLDDLTDKAQAIGNEEDFLAAANGDISQLCGEMILLWNTFLDSFIGKSQIVEYLAKVHHLHRMRRFSEAFFLVGNSRSTVLECVESKYRDFAATAESLRSSRYLQTLPKLPVSCLEVDGDAASLPIIFEDSYQGDEEVAAAAREAEVEGVVGMRRGRRRSDGDVEGIEEFSSTSIANGTTAAITVSHHNNNDDGGKSQQKRPSSVPSSKKLENKDSLCESGSSLATKRSSSGGLPQEHHLKKELDVLAREGGRKQVLLDTATKDEGDAAAQAKSFKQRLKHNMRRDQQKQNSSGVPLKHLRMSAGAICSSNTEGGASGEGGGEHKLISKDTSGFSHLEWSASVPYNLAEEPDEVCGMKHSHSCQSMPSVTLEQLSQKKSMCSPSTPSQKAPIDEETSVITSHNEKITNLDEQAVKETEPSIISPPATNIDEAIKQMEVDLEHFSKADDPLALSSSSTSASSSSATEQKPGQQQQQQPESQEALSRKLEELRAKSRSTEREGLLMLRPRAKSEETAIVAVAATTVGDQPRASLSSSGDPPTSEVCTETAGELLNAPKLVQSLLEDKFKPKKASPLPPPVQFRDPPAATKTDGDKENAGRKKALSIQQSLEESILRRRSQIELTYSASMKPISPVSPPLIVEEGRGDTGPVVTHSTEGREEEKKEKKKKSDKLPLRDNFFLVEHTGDCLEEKSLPKPKRLSSTSEVKLPLGNASNKLIQSPDLLVQRLVSVIGDDTLTFIRAKETFKKSLIFPGILFSDLSCFPSFSPYFHLCGDIRLLATQSSHLIVCVHGLDGNSADLRLIKTYLEMALPGNNFDFLMSEVNQGDTFSSFETMTDRLVDEILVHLRQHSALPSRISFVGHSLGCILIRSAISRPKMAHLVPRFYTYLALSGPHLGTLYNNSGLVNMGMWIMQKWKKSGSLHQLALKDAVDIRRTFLYQLSLRSNLHKFRHVLLVGSTQDRYVPWHSARIELCKSAVKDTSVTGAAYREMVHNILSPIVNRGSAVTLIRYDIHHSLPSNTNAFVGRHAHIAVLDSDLFIEKFLIISALKYFK